MKFAAPRLSSVCLALPCLWLVAPVVSAQTTAKRVDDLQQQIWQLKMGGAELKPSDTAFGIARTTLTPVPVAIDNVEPYATGSKVFLRLGNITSANFGNMKLRVWWGNYGKNGERVTSDKQEVIVDVLNPIAAGAWGSVEIPIPGTPPEKLGYLFVFVDEGPAISLRSK